MPKLKLFSLIASSRTSLLIITCSIAINIFIFIQVYQAESEVLQSKFLSQATTKLDSFENDLRKCLDNNEVLANFLMITRPTSHQQFQLHTHKLFETFPSVQAYEWIVLLNHSNRNQLETEIKKVYPKFQIFQYSSDGSKKVITPKDFYYPIYFIEPYKGNEQAIGFDLSTEPIRFKAILESQQTRNSMATSRVQFMALGEKQFGLLLITPVFDQQKNLIQSIDSSKPLIGFAASVLNIEHAINANLHKFPNNDLHYQIIDITDKDQVQDLFVSPTLGPQANNKDSIKKSIFSLEHEIDFAGRKLLLRTESLPSAFGIHNNWKLWGTTVIGILMTLVLLIYNRIETTRKHLIQEAEINFEALFSAIPDGVIIYNNSNEILYFNEIVKKILGFNKIHLNLKNKIKLNEALPPDWIHHIHQLQNSIDLPSDESFQHLKFHIPNSQATFVEMTVSKTLLNGRSAFLLSLHDVSDLVKFQDDLQFTVLHDSLTKLPNRLLLHDRLERAQVENERKKD